jgi:hypothetical protein
MIVKLSGFFEYNALNQLLLSPHIKNLDTPFINQFQFLLSMMEQLKNHPCRGIINYKVVRFGVEN